MTVHVSESFMGFPWTRSHWQLLQEGEEHLISIRYRESTRTILSVIGTKRAGRQKTKYEEQLTTQASAEAVCQSWVPISDRPGKVEHLTCGSYWSGIIRRKHVRVT